MHAGQAMIGAARVEVHQQIECILVTWQLSPKIQVQTLLKLRRTFSLSPSSSIVFHSTSEFDRRCISFVFRRFSGSNSEWLALHRFGLTESALSIAEMDIILCEIDRLRQIWLSQFKIICHVMPWFNSFRSREYWACMSDDCAEQ